MRLLALRRNLSYQRAPDALSGDEEEIVDVGKVDKGKGKTLDRDRSRYLSSLYDADDEDASKSSRRKAASSSHGSLGEESMRPLSPSGSSGEKKRREEKKKKQRKKMKKKATVRATGSDGYQAIIDRVPTALSYDSQDSAEDVLETRSKASRYTVEGASDEEDLMLSSSGDEDCRSDKYSKGGSAKKKKYKKVLADERDPAPLVARLWSDSTDNSCPARWRSWSDNEADADADDEDELKKIHPGVATKKAESPANRQDETPRPRKASSGKKKKKKKSSSSKKKKHPKGMSKDESLATTEAPTEVPSIAETADEDDTAAVNDINSSDKKSKSKKKKTNSMIGSVKSATSSKSGAGQEVLLSTTTTSDDASATISTAGRPTASDLTGSLASPGPSPTAAKAAAMAADLMKDDNQQRLSGTAMTILPLVNKKKKDKEDQKKMKKNKKSTKKNDKKKKKKKGKRASTDMDSPKNSPRSPNKYGPEALRERKEKASPTSLNKKGEATKPETAPQPTLPRTKSKSPRPSPTSSKASKKKKSATKKPKATKADSAEADAANDPTVRRSTVKLAALLAAKTADTPNSAEKATKKMSPKHVVVHHAPKASELDNTGTISVESELDNTGTISVEFQDGGGCLGFVQHRLPGAGSKKKHRQLKEIIDGDDKYQADTPPAAHNSSDDNNQNDTKPRPMASPRQMATQKDQLALGSFPMELDEYSYATNTSQEPSLVQCLKFYSCGTAANATLKILNWQPPAPVEIAAGLGDGVVNQRGLNNIFSCGGSPGPKVEVVLEELGEYDNGVWKEALPQAPSLDVPAAHSLVLEVSDLKLQLDNASGFSRKRSHTSSAGGSDETDSVDGGISITSCEIPTIVRTPSEIAAMKAAEKETSANTDDEEEGVSRRCLHSRALWGSSDRGDSSEKHEKANGSSSSESNSDRLGTTEQVVVDEEEMPTTRKRGKIRRMFGRLAGQAGHKKNAKK